MTTKVKTHKRKKKNGVSVVREHSRKDGKSTRKGAGDEFEKKFSASRINRVNKAYDDEGLKPPKGKGIHKVAFHERAAKIMGSMKKSGKGVNKNLAYAIAMKQLGKKKSVLKEHQR